MDSKKTYPKILIISHNCISERTNNGKTIYSIFRDWPQENISQIFFRNEYPDSASNFNFFRITDLDLLKDWIPFCKESSGLEIKNKFYSKKTFSVNPVNKNSLLFFLRDIYWNIFKKNNEKLDNWIKNQSPEYVFFVASNNTFSYNFTLNIIKNFNLKLISFFTDDYIMPVKKPRFIQEIHRIKMESKFKQLIGLSNVRIAIGEIMAKEYFNRYNLKFNFTMNLPEEFNFDQNIEYLKPIKIVYVGNLGLKRWISILEITKQICLLNKNYLICTMDIYSLENPDENFIKTIESYDNINFLGKLNSQIEVNSVLSEAQVVIHSESFDPKMIEITRLSISTKISEYLSMGKCIFAYGPSNVGSMRFLFDNNLGLCCFDSKNLYTSLSKLLNNSNLMTKYSIEGKRYYNNKMKNFKLINLINES